MSAPDLKTYIADSFRSLLGDIRVEVEMDGDTRAGVWIFGEEWSGETEKSVWKFVAENGCSSLMFPKPEDLGELKIETPPHWAVPPVR